jgi:osmotically-inducible protein OsmY
MRNTFTIRLFAAILLTSFLSGCAVLAVGGVAAGVSVMADRRSPAVQAIDKGISLEVENALDKKFGDGAHINVTAFNQKVLLTGEVKDASIKEQAGSYAKANKNVRSVFNEMIISQNSTFSARANDSYLESKIKTQMIFTDKLPSNSMAIVAEGSSIYLMGMLTQSEAEIAKKVTSNTNGVKDVYAYFDIISDAEKSRIEKQSVADEPQPSSTPKQ